MMNDFDFTMTLMIEQPINLSWWAADPTTVSRRPTRASGGLAVPDSHHN
jgi:hypothetical protein